MEYSDGVLYAETLLINIVKTQEFLYARWNAKENT